MARSYNVSFNINGALDGSLLAALRNAATAMRGLGNAARAASATARASQTGLQGLASSLTSLQQAAQRFRELKRAAQETQAALTATQSGTNSLAAKYRQDMRAAEELRRKLEQLRQQRGRQEESVSQGRAELNLLRRQRAELKAMAKELGATRGRKIPRELLGTEQGQRLAQVLSKIKDNAKAIEEARSRFRATREELNSLAQKMRETQNALREQERAARQSGAGFEASKAKAQQLKEQLQQQQEAIHRLRQSLSNAGFSTANFAASEARLAADINRVNAALARQTELMNAQRASQQASQNMFNAYNNFQSALQTAETIAAPFKSAAENAMNFEYAMSKVKSLTQMRNIRAGNLEQVRVEMEALTKQAERLGATTEFTSQEVAEAMGFYGMAGWDTSRIQNAMQHTIDLATIAGDHNIQRMADVLSDDMTAMGLKAGEMLTLANGKTVESSKYFADAFAYALTNANVNRESLHEALKYNAPIAKQWGLTMGEEFAINMMSANAGIKGSMAGTGLRAGLLRISAPPKKAAKAFAEMGLSMSDAQKELAEGQAAMQAYGVTIGDFATTLKSLSQVYNTLGRGERLGFVDAVFGKNASSFWANILDKGNVEDVLKAAGEIDSGWVADYASDTASVMRDNTKISLELLKSSFDALQRSIGDALTPALRAAAEAFAPMVTAAGEWIAAHPAVVQGIAAIAGALAGLIVSAAAVKLAFAGWTFIATSIQLVSTALASLGSGAMLGGVIGRIAALRTALFGLGGAATIGGWGAMFATISTKAATAATAVRTFFTSLTLGGVASGVTSVLSSIGTAIMGVARASLSLAFSPVGAALLALGAAAYFCYQNWDRVSAVLSNIANIITNSLGSAIAAIQPALANLSAAFDNLLGNGALTGALSVIGQLVTGALATVVTTIAGILGTVINVGAQILATLANVISGIVNLISNVLSGNWSAAWDSLKSIATSALEGIGNVATAIFDGILATVNGIRDAWAFLSGRDLPQAPHGDMAHGGGGGSFGEPVQSAPAPVQAPVTPEAPAIDTSATQAALDAVGSSAQNAATNMDGVNTAAQNIQQAGTNLQTLGTNVQAAGTTVQTLGTNSQTAGTNVQTLGTNSQAAGLNVQAMGNASQMTAPQVDSLGTSAGMAFGNVDLLGGSAGTASGQVDAMSSAAGAVAEALRGKAAEIGAIHISVPTVSVGGAPAAANYMGGIYRKGAFLTTFAERAPEAAIPLDGSRRAQDLWTQAGQMLGMLPKTESTPFDETPRNATKIKIPQGREMTRSGPWGQVNQRNTTKLPTIPKIFQQNQSAAKIPFIPQIFTQTQPRTYDVFGGIAGDLPNQILSLGREASGVIGGLVDKLIGNTPAPAHDTAPIINLTVNVTINGNADEQTVRRGVEDALPAVEDWAARLSSYKREQRRRSYA